jgi:hypothetical protein
MKLPLSPVNQATIIASPKVTLNWEPPANPTVKMNNPAVSTAI